MRQPPKQGRPKRKDSMKGITIKSGLKRPTDKGAGLSEKAVKIINRRTGGNLKTAVTESKPRTKARAARRKSYCARSLGQLKKISAKTRNNPNSRIRQARRRWKC